MLDRGSIFADAELVELLRGRFVSVAVDVDDLQTREGATGDFFRHVVLQRNGMHLDRSTQGHYVATTDGELLHGSNHRDSAMLLRQLRSTLVRADPQPATAKEAVETGDSNEPKLPDGVTVVEVFTRVLDADWPAPTDADQLRAQRATGRDFLWITAAERQALTADPPAFPASLARRIARFHIVDNTRCSPLVWNRADTRELAIDVDGTGHQRQFHGHAAATTADGQREYHAVLVGDYEVRDGALVRFDLVIRATFRGDGKWSTGAPPGDYVVAIAFRIAQSAYASRVFPGSANRVDEYLDAPCTSLPPPR